VSRVLQNTECGWGIVLLCDGAHYAKKGSWGYGRGRKQPQNACFQTPQGLSFRGLSTIEVV
jgi:hypothetical protein